jgi:ABC-type lipoprotein release transport system permease subunit
MRERTRPRIAHRRLQTILAVAALGTAVALPVVLLSVGGGVFAHELSKLTSSGYQLAVSSSGVHGINDAHGLSGRIAGIPGVDQVSPILSAPLDVFTPGGLSPALAEGIVPGAFSATQGPTESVLFPNPMPLGDPTDRLHWANGSYAGPSAGRVVISTPFAAAEGLRVGDELSLGATPNRSEAVPFLVSGTFGVEAASLGPVAAFGLLIPLSDLQILTGLADPSAGLSLDAADTLQIRLADPQASDPGAVARVGQDIASLVPYYTVDTVSNQAAQVRAAEAVLTGFYLGLSAVGLIVGLGFLSLILVREVEVERRSIGIRRALGVPSSSIVGGILLRGYSLAAAGATAGILLGILLVGTLAEYAGGTVETVARLAEFDPLTLAELGLAVVGLSGIAGALAARSALRRPISEVLR